jgi:Holliday junction DNA helicase RuvB
MPSYGASAAAVGLSTLAVTVGEEAETIESVVEPYLVRIGFLGRTPRGASPRPRHTPLARAAARGARDLR